LSSRVAAVAVAELPLAVAVRVDSVLAQVYL
jgi:hypothetical protein